MTIEKFFPSALLQPFVREYIVIESNQETGNKTLPGTSLVLALRFRGKVMKEEGRTKEMIPSSALSGLRKTARTHWYGENTGNLLVIFREGGLEAFSRIPAHELFGQNIPDENLFPTHKPSEITERLAEARSNRERVNLVETFLTGRLSPQTPDKLVFGAIQLIKHQNGNIRIKDLAAALSISQDPLEKRFRSLTGATPKQFASIIRLHTLIRRFPSYPSLTEAAYEAGYFDQSHFIKDFRQFTGLPPKEFFQSSRYW